MEKSSKGTKSGYSTTSRSYKALLAHIIRKKATPKNPNHLVNLYLDCFMTFTKKMCGPTVVASGQCDEGKFTEWRKEQKRLGNLDWDTKIIADKAIPPEYRIGPKLAKYIKLVADEHGLGATKGYVDMKIAALEERVSMLAAGVDEMIELYDPPVTEAKRKVYYPSPAKLLAVHRAKISIRIVDDEVVEFPDYSKSLDS
jgi:hypothetical protein